MPSDRRAEGLGQRSVVRVEGGRAVSVPDLLAEEVPVAIHFNGESFAVMMASPADLEDFARGFALTEASVPADDIAGVDVRVLLEGIQVDIRTRRPVSSRDDAQARRALPGRSGCGICGLRELEDVIRSPRPVRTGQRIERAALEAAIAALPDAQRLNAESGALHAAAWARADGTLVRVREDVGRHNALDKLIGALSRGDIDGEAGFAIVTSRASYEMVTKAATAGFPLLVAFSAPTALAVDLAQSCGLTLAGFVRPGRHVIYSHPWRLGA